MAGLGRRSHYRKYLTDSVLNDFPEPKSSEGERIAQVVGSRGGNLLEIQVAPPPPTNDGDEGDSEESQNNTNSNNKKQPQLALLPTKFRKLVWVKRGDYIIVGGDETAQKQDTGKASISTEDENEHQDNENIKVRYMVHHILYRDQVKHLKSLGVWPKQFMSADEEVQQQEAMEGEEEQGSSKQIAVGNTASNREAATDRATAVDTAEDDQDYYTEESEDEQDDSDLFVNTNRLAKLRVDETSDSDEGSNTEDDY